MAAKVVAVPSATTSSLSATLSSSQPPHKTGARSSVPVFHVRPMEKSESEGYQEDDDDELQLRNFRTDLSEPSTASSSLSMSSGRQSLATMEQLPSSLTSAEVNGMLDETHAFSPAYHSIGDISPSLTQALREVQWFRFHLEDVRQTVINTLSIIAPGVDVTQWSLVQQFVQATTQLSEDAYILQIKQRLQHASKDEFRAFLQDFPPISIVHQEDKTLKELLHEISIKWPEHSVQDEKDIVRDTIVINGILVHGSEGYQLIMDHVMHAIQNILLSNIESKDTPSSESSSAYPSTSPSASSSSVSLVAMESSTQVTTTSNTVSSSSSSLHSFMSFSFLTGTKPDDSSSTEDSTSKTTLSDLAALATLLLRRVNRTNSGGISFEHLLDLFRRDDIVTISPNSEDAEPLQLTVAGPTIVLRTTLSFKLCDSELVGTDDDALWAIAKVTYISKVDIVNLSCTPTTTIYVTVLPPRHPSLLSPSAALTPQSSTPVHSEPSSASSSFIATAKSTDPTS